MWWTLLEGWTSWVFRRCSPVSWPAIGAVRELSTKVRAAKKAMGGAADTFVPFLCVELKKCGASCSAYVVVAGSSGLCFPNTSVLGLMKRMVCSSVSLAKRMEKASRAATVAAGLGCLCPGGGSLGTDVLP